MNRRSVPGIDPWRVTVTKNGRRLRLPTRLRRPAPALRGTGRTADLEHAVINLGCGSAIRSVPPRPAGRRGDGSDRAERGRSGACRPGHRHGAIGCGRVRCGPWRRTRRSPPRRRHAGDDDRRDRGRPAGSMGDRVRIRAAGRRPFCPRRSCCCTTAQFCRSFTCFGWQDPSRMSCCGGRCERSGSNGPRRQLRQCRQRRGRWGTWSTAVGRFGLSSIATLRSSTPLSPGALRILNRLVVSPGPIARDRIAALRSRYCGQPTAYGLRSGIAADRPNLPRR